jgi:hypothetical protein
MPSTVCLSIIHWFSAANGRYYLPAKGTAFFGLMRMEMDQIFMLMAVDMDKIMLLQKILVR